MSPHQSRPPWHSWSGRTTSTSNLDSHNVRLNRQQRSAPVSRQASGSVQTQRSGSGSSRTENSIQSLDAYSRYFQTTGSNQSEIA